MYSGSPASSKNAQEGDGLAGNQLQIDKHAVVNAVFIIFAGIKINFVQPWPGSVLNSTIWAAASGAPGYKLLLPACICEQALCG